METISDAKLKSILDTLDILTDDERLEIINRYCKYCGCKDQGCQCWNNK